MGMGEPLDNLDAVLEAFHVLTDEDGLGLSWRRVTISTVGLVPGIRRLARESRRPRLAVSLTATEDGQRSRLVPVNRKWPIAALCRAVAEFPVRSGERVTFEYVLLAGENDTPDDARRLASQELVRWVLEDALPVRVNLLPWNEHPGPRHSRPTDSRVEEFRDTLRASGIDVTIRLSRGRDIGAACGQLAIPSPPAAGSAAI